MRIVVAGMGVQGAKRKRIAGADVVATVDPVAEADFKRIEDVPLDRYDAVLACIPDQPKIAALGYLLSHGKHVLVEKPLFAKSESDIAALKKLSAETGAVCYTAYNHRFEPHFVRMKKLIDSRALGRIYTVRLFYGNGTARLVRESAWRDSGDGVLSDLGSHLLDTILFWIGEPKAKFKVLAANNFENKAPDHVVLSSEGDILVQLEMTMLSWRNHFVADILAEKGSAHIESLCKWGPSTFRYRRRVLPSGRPPEDAETLVQDDPTWALEYEHFLKLCAAKAPPNLERDMWLSREIGRLGEEALKA